MSTAARVSNLGDWRIDGIQYPERLPNQIIDVEPEFLSDEDMLKDEGFVGHFERAKLQGYHFVEPRAMAFHSTPRAALFTQPEFGPSLRPDPGPTEPNTGSEEVFFLSSDEEVTLTIFNIDLWVTPTQCWRLTDLVPESQRLAGWSSR